MPSVYLETTIPSYLVARPSPDGELAAKQAITRAWWENHRHSYELVTSTSVLDEARNGDPNQRDLRLASLVGVHVLMLSPEVEFIGAELLRKGWVPPGANLDAFHVAFASAYQVNFLLTWNCSHLANPTSRRPIERWLRNLDKHIPVICTPTDLMEYDHDH
ncbi:MAG: type II toxin-antitoxin system VapC family toxin [Planctomycetota bacterium]